MIYMNTVFIVTVLGNTNIFCVDKHAVFFDVKQLVRTVATMAERVNFLVYVCSVGKAFRY
jgi:hypothetical protein